MIAMIGTSDWSCWLAEACESLLPQKGDVAAFFLLCRWPSKLLCLVLHDHTMTPSMEPMSGPVQAHHYVCVALVMCGTVYRP